MGSPKWIDSLGGNKDKPTFLEDHYTIKELAASWRMPLERVKKMFEQESDIFRYGTGRLSKKAKRAYVSLRIPESVVRRVYEKHKREEAVKELPIEAGQGSHGE